jgi:hypothetical protein
MPRSSPTLTLAFPYHRIILATCAPYAQDELAGDLDAGWQAVAAATVDDKV